MSEREVRWRAVLERQRTCGMSIAAFCRLEGIRSNHFHWWRRRLFGPARKTKKSLAKRRVKFVELSPSSRSLRSLAGEIEIGTRRGHTIRVGPEASPELIRRIFDIVEGRSEAC